jgi:hypothetical protein
VIRLETLAEMRSKRARCGANGQEAPKTDARQLDVGLRAGLIIALTSPTGSSAPRGRDQKAHFVDRGRNEPGHTET